MDVTVTVDQTEAPLFVFTYPSTATIEEIQRVFKIYSELSVRYSGIVWVVDLRLLNPLTMPASARRAFADEYEKARHIIEKATIGEARVVSSGLTQGVVTAVDWLTSRPYKKRNFTDMEQAKAWGRELIKKAAR